MKYVMDQNRCSSYRFRRVLISADLNEKILIFILPETLEHTEIIISQKLCKDSQYLFINKNSSEKFQSDELLPYCSHGTRQRSDFGEAGQNCRFVIGRLVCIL